MRLLVILFALCAAATLTLVSCGKRQTMWPAAALPSECVVVSAPAASPAAVTVALLAPVDPGYAPWARNGSEQLLFNQLYETLITRDCTGQVQPGLAESWQRHDGGRRWTFVLRKDARFSDGSRVTAQDVLDSWERVAIEPLNFYAEVEYVQPDGERVLDVYFRRPHRSIPLALSSPALAVTKPNGMGWPFGSGPYQMTSDPMTARASRGRAGPALHFVDAAAREPRDLLEGRVDMMVTRDPSVVGYALASDQLDAVALPWDVTYLLLATSRARVIASGGALPDIDVSVLDALARDAVRVDARGFRAEPWWSDLKQCGDLTDAFDDWSPTMEGTGSRQVVYEAGDPIARDLARRIVSLSGMDSEASNEAAAMVAAVPELGEGRLSARGLSADALATSLWNARDFAYIVAIPNRPSDPCYAGRQLIHRAPWLTLLDGRFVAAILPLIDSRRHLVVRKERVGVSVDWFGNVLVMGSGVR